MKRTSSDDELVLILGACHSQEKQRQQGEFSDLIQELKLSSIFQDFSGVADLGQHMRRKRNNFRDLIASYSVTQQTSVPPC